MECRRGISPKDLQVNQPGIDSEKKKQKNPERSCSDMEDKKMYQRFSSNILMSKTHTHTHIQPHVFTHMKNVHRSKCVCIYKHVHKDENK